MVAQASGGPEIHSDTARAGEIPRQATSRFGGSAMVQMAVDTNKTSPHHSGHSLSALSLAALGVVYGDIGTSPLYTLKVVLGATGKHPAPEAVLGSLSLIVWTLIIITTVKYIILALRVDNEGEGGVLALMALLSRKPGRRLVLFIGMFGAALVYGDCALTPAISVLSALEGLDVIAPELGRFVLPGTVAILAALFAVQQRGTAVLGRIPGAGHGDLVRGARPARPVGDRTVSGRVMGP